MVKLTEASGTVVYEDGNKLYISTKPAQWTTTFLFVVGLLSLILLANGVLQLFIFNTPTENPVTPGIILTGLSIGKRKSFFRWNISNRKDFGF